MLIGSPMCMAFSTWQFLNDARRSNAAAAEAAKAKAIQHMNFAASFYLEQIQAGRYFLHKHPRHASSWKLQAMEELMRIPGVTFTYGDQCKYGAQVAHGPPKGCPIKKPMGFLSNSKSLASALSKTCAGTGGVCFRGGRHGHCSDRIVKEAAIYLRGLCQAVTRGIVEQLRED